jgi:type II secretion system protein G
MSLIEIMIVILIIGLFTGIGLPRLYKALSGAKIKKTKVLLPSLKATIVEYHSDNQQYPSRLQDLVVRPSDAKPGRWHQYIENEDGLKDGWGNDFVYKRNPAGPGAGKRPFELYSWGENGEGSPQEEWINVWDI